MAEEKKETGKRKVPKGRHLSAIKRHRQSLRRQERNIVARSSMRTAVKKVMQAVEKKDATLAKDLLKQAMSQLHRAASKGLVHYRNAARHISRLSSMVAKVG
jgi:small subunit ribosomal protein S20